MPALESTTIDFVYYGDINNTFLVPEGHDVDAEADSRRATLNRLKEYSRDDFQDRDIYNSLEGKSSIEELVADALSGVFSFFRASEPLIHIVAPDMKQYWNPESAFGSDVRYPMIRPLRDAMDRNDEIMVIAHSLGTMIAYDTFWKFSRTGEYRDEYGEKNRPLRFNRVSPWR